MDKTEQLIRLMIDKQNKHNKFVKIVISLIFITLLFTSYIICVNIALSERKTDYRYFNLTRSLEDINNVHIDTYDGSAYKTIEDLNNVTTKRKDNETRKTYYKKFIKIITN